jgi:hypothetical protein
MGVTITASGPLFDQRAQNAGRDGAKAAEKAVAVLGASMIRSRMDAVFRVQTPFYRLQNIAEQAPPGWIIWDQDATAYGFWLEGIGSRNKTTRFKGYFTYRRITQELRGRAPTIAAGVFRPFLERMR